MKKIINELAEIISKKYFLDKNALINENPDIMYMDMSDGLIEINKHNHLSKVISKDKKVISAFIAIQILLSL